MHQFVEQFFRDDGAALVDFHQDLVDREYGELEMEMVIMDRVGHTGNVPGSITRDLLAVFH